VWSSTEVFTSRFRSVGSSRTMTRSKRSATLAGSIGMFVMSVVVTPGFVSLMLRPQLIAITRYSNP
jgi:hypothetical protein